jgi:hypothetical protein
MTSEVEMLAEYNGKCEANEAQYVLMRTRVQMGLQKSMAMRGALDSFELKLNRAVLEFERELKTIEQNFVGAVERSING